MEKKINFSLDFEAEFLACLPDPSATLAYLETLRSDPYQEPERRLMLAVMEDGVSTFQNNVLNETPEGRTLVHETEEWILRKDDRYVFSWDTICHIIGLDSDCLRNGLMNWRERLLQHSS